MFCEAVHYDFENREDWQPVLKQLVNETDLRIDNLLKLREPCEHRDDEFHLLAAVHFKS